MSSSDKVRVLRDALRNRMAIAPFSIQEPGFTAEQGYTVQQLSLELEVREGAVLAGYKMGLTSRAKQRDVQVYEPIRGYLLESMQLLKAEPLKAAERIHPRVEPEVAVVLKDRLAGPVRSLSQVIAALSHVLPAAEILDSRFEAYKFSLPDVIADNTSASGFLLGSVNYIDRLEELRLMGITLKKNGKIVETGAPAAVLGDPLLSVASLANQLAREGRALEPGMVVLTGGITASVPVRAGDWVELVWPGETLSLRIE